jgi:hypothetical protein
MSTTVDSATDSGEAALAVEDPFGEFAAPAQKTTAARSSSSSPTTAPSY